MTDTLDKKSGFLGTDEIFPLLMKMSIPAVVAMLVGALFNVVDTIFVGQAAGPLAIAGLTIAFPLQLIVMAFANMIGVGAASIISRRLGQKMYDKVESAFDTALFSITVLSVIITILSLVFSEKILLFFGASAQTLPYVNDYVKIVAWGFLFSSVSQTGSSLVRAEGKANTSMAIMLTGMILNIILDPIFIFAMGMGIKGAALATVISQAVSAVWVISIHLRRKEKVHFDLRHLSLDGSQFVEMLLIGFPTFIQTAGTSILMIIGNNVLLRYVGDIGVSIYGVTNRVLSFVIMPVTGISQGFQPIAGFNYGAKKFDRVKKVLISASLSAAVFAGIICVILELFPRSIFSVFSSDPLLLAEGVLALRIMSSLITLMGVQIVFSIYFQAIGKKTKSLILGLLRQFIILIPLLILLPRYFGGHAFWYAFPISDFLSTIITTFFLIYELRHLDESHWHAIKST